MNKNLKKIAITTIFSVASLSAIGCGYTNKTSNKMLQNHNNEIQTNLKNYSSDKATSVGKIVSAANTEHNYISPRQTLQSETTPTQNMNGNYFKLYVISNIPFVDITSTDSNQNASRINNNQNTYIDKEKLNELNLKKSVLMIYVNEIQNGNVNLTEENKNEINRQVEIIKQNNVFTNQTYNNENFLNQNNQTNKINSTISAIDSILNIVENNLTTSSKYYQSNLTKNYGSFITNNNQNIQENDNYSLAQNIAKSLNMKITESNENQSQNNNISTLEENYLNNQNTQNNANISRNNSINNNLNQNINNTNPRQNTTNHRTKDIRDADRLSVNQNTSNNQSNIMNNISNENNNLTTQNITPRTIRANRYPERSSTTNTSQTVQQNNAVRVPYQANT